METISHVSEITRITTPKHTDHKCGEIYSLGCLMAIVEELDERITRLERSQKSNGDKKK